MRGVRPTAWLLAGLGILTTDLEATAPRQDSIPPPPARSPAPDTTGPAPSDAGYAIVSPEVPAGPRPAGTRLRFTRDSLVWTSALTVGDLLANIPGVYVARAGFLGQPEYLLYQGRGAAGVEVYWDGVPWHPIGGDTVYVDLGQINLSFLRQIDVEILPALLRVYLVSERHEGPDPRSVLRVVSGGFSTAEYAGLFQWRWPSGVGLTLGGDFVTSEGAPESGRNDQHLDLWAKLDWLPQPGGLGVSYQVRRQSMERDPNPTEAGGEVPFRQGRRTDALFRVFAGPAPDRPGFGVELGVGSSTWTNDTTLSDQLVRHAFAAARYRRRMWFVESVARVGDRRITGDLLSRVGWAPFPGIGVSGEARWQWFAGRATRTLTGEAGARVGPLSLLGHATTGERVAAPALVTDSGQTVRDTGVRLGVDTPRLGGGLSVTQRSVFAPPSFPDLPIAALDTSVAATYLLADVRVRPVYPLTFQAWYGQPRERTPDFHPPRHVRAHATFRSKYWRTFRSGAFDVMIRWSFESWSEGTAGIDDTGAPRVLPATRFQEWFIQFQLVQFHVFWNLRNATNAIAGYVPGFPYPRNAQTFGVKWTFRN